MLAMLNLVKLKMFPVHKRVEQLKMNHIFNNNWFFLKKELINLIIFVKNEIKHGLDIHVIQLQLPTLNVVAVVTLNN